MKSTNTLLSALLIIVIIIGAFFVKKEVNNKKDNKESNFVSTLYDVSYIRTGPGKDYPAKLVIKHKLFPLQVLRERNQWYEIRDIKGRTGWIFKSIVSPKRTAIITTESNIRSSINQNSRIVVVANKNNIVEIIKCDNIRNICKVRIIVDEEGITKTGWIKKINLWGNTNQN